MTNEVEIKNNIWTLTKHLSGSINKAAAKVDAKVYGPIVKQGTVQLPPQRPAPVAKEDTGVFTIIGIIVVAILVVVVFIGFFSGHIKGRDIIGF